jgi:hypothetical protein
MWMIQPAQARQKWLPRSGVVAENLMVVAGDLVIPAVSKLNAGRSWKRHPRLPPLSTCQNLGNLSLSLFLPSLLLFLY